MSKVLWLAALLISAPTFSWAFATADYHFTEPKGWNSVPGYGGADVGYIKASNLKQRQVLLIATSPAPIPLDKNNTYLKNEMDKLKAEHKDLQVARFAEVSGAPKNAYVKYSFKDNGMTKNEILVAVPSKKKTHFILLSSDGEETEGAERELLAMVHSFKLK